MLSEYDQNALFRILKKGIFKDNNCFEWSGSIDEYGYGVTSYGYPKKTWRLHRLIYHILVSEIPNEMLICHACDNPKCFNVNHLFLGTCKDNSQDREKKGRGLRKIGSENPMATLNECTVLLLRKKYESRSFKNERRIYGETIMEILKAIVTTLSPAAFMLIIMVIVLNWSVITAADSIRIPRRFIRKIMNHEEHAKKEVHEYYRLKKFIESLDLPLREKESLNWSIESAEKRCIETITEATRDAILKDLRSKDEDAI